MKEKEIEVNVMNLLIDRQKSITFLIKEELMKESPHFLRKEPRKFNIKLFKEVRKRMKKYDGIVDEMIAQDLQELRDAKKGR